MKSSAHYIEQIMTHIALLFMPESRWVSNCAGQTSWHSSPAGRDAGDGGTRFQVINITMHLIAACALFYWTRDLKGIQKTRFTLLRMHGRATQNSKG
jgi:hypothetical protein